MSEKFDPFAHNTPSHSYPIGTIEEFDAAMSSPEAEASRQATLRSILEKTTSNASSVVAQ